MDAADSTPDLPFLVFADGHADGERPVSRHGTLWAAELSAIEWSAHCRARIVARGSICGTFLAGRRQACAI